MTDRRGYRDGRFEATSRYRGCKLLCVEELGGGPNSLLS